MHTSTQHRTGYPSVTRREASSLAASSEHLSAIEDRQRFRMYGSGPQEARCGAVLAERASVAREALHAFLIAAKVYDDSAQAAAALDRV